MLGRSETGINREAFRVHAWGRLRQCWAVKARGLPIGSPVAGSDCLLLRLRTAGRRIRCSGRRASVGALSDDVSRILGQLLGLRQQLKSLEHLRIALGLHLQAFLLSKLSDKQFGLDM